MNCAHCGREVDDGSVVCPYCGKKTSNAPNPKAERFARMTFFPGGMILFLVFAYEMVPGTAEGVYTYYAIFAGVVGLLSLALWLALRKRHTKGAVAALILIPALLVASTVGLRGTYYVKFDEAVASAPSSGVVPVRFTYEDAYYNDTGEGYVTDCEVHISVEGKRIGQGGVARVELFKAVAVEGVSTFMSDGKSYLATGSASAVLTPSQLVKGYEFAVYCDSEDDSYCKITVTATYYPDFWDVVLD